MGLFEELEPASYRGVSFLVVSVSTAGGRKDSKKQFVDSDLQNIEDLGLNQRIFTVNAVVSERSSIDGSVITPYLQSRNALLDALESDAGPGILVHPWYGRLENIVCRTWSIEENIRNLGDGRITIVFEISNTDGVPIATEFVLTRVSLKHEDVIETSKGIFETIWNVTSETFTDGLAKANSFIEAVNAATAPITTLATKINQHTNLISNFSVNVTSLIAAPVALSDAITGIMFSVGGLFSTSNGTLIAFTNLFDFGDNDVDSSFVTSITLERDNNDDVFNAMVQAQALSYAYFNTSQIEFETVQSIEDAADVLEVQYQKLIAVDVIDPDIIEELTELRETTQGFFDEQKLNASQTIIVDINAPQSGRSIAFAYYGSSERGDAIGQLNELLDYVYIQGPLEIFTA